MPSAFQTTQQRLIDQVAVPRDTNDEAAVAAHLPQIDLAGVCVTADAAHITKANCRQLTQGNGAEFTLAGKSYSDVPHLPCKVSS